ncbi:MAG: AmmeMemoRadiSam system radical SAM enzyme [Planctomycetaceae bacterium]|jgi:pyruvate formate lyase activating enzyme|nr:AmmeMemoRadiSam system radical SAM enzyme [Planctomycetaceae bacterium]
MPITCPICPRHCSIARGQTGFCKVRTNVNDQIVSTVYGRTSGCAVDPMEKKPLYHFYPASPIFSVGTLGCNMSCRWCQNAAISKTGDVEKFTRLMSPGEVAEAAVTNGCESVAVTYNEPVVWAEYAVDIAEACHERRLNTVAVTNGFIASEKRSWFFNAMDAANIDLKGFSEQFYKQETGAELEALKETIQFVAHETNCWLELTTLLIPGVNDNIDDMQRMGEWICKAIGAETPLHLSAFHPAHEYQNIATTPLKTLFQTREIMKQCGLCYVYVGNVNDSAGQITQCPQCGQAVILRYEYKVEDIKIDEDQCCRYCGQTIAGRFNN